MKYDIDLEFLRKNRDILVETNCHLDLLKIDSQSFKIHSKFIELLKILPEHRFYKSLHFQFRSDFGDEQLRYTISTLPQFERRYQSIALYVLI